VVTVREDSGRSFSGKYVIKDGRLTLGTRFGSGRSRVFMEVDDAANFGRALETQEERERWHRRERRQQVVRAGIGTLGCLFLAGLAAVVILLVTHATHYR